MQIQYLIFAIDLKKVYRSVCTTSSKVIKSVPKSQTLNRSGHGMVIEKTTKLE